MAIINLLGIDPSLTNTGMAVISVDCSTAQIVAVKHIALVETAPSKIKSVRESSDALERARKIRAGVLATIAQHQIKLAVSEVPSGAQSASACYAFGIVVGLLAALPVPLIEVSPGEVKMAVGGKKSVDKEDIVRWALTLPGDLSGMPASPQKNEWQIANPFGKGYISKKAEHPADACGAVAAALKTQQFRQLAAMLASII
jgi:Holliday junction resolvasome RuvABC endonuclease subunit